jgi:hypothetical protein
MYKLYLDMDGVLTDYESGFLKISNGKTFEEYKEQHGFHGCLQLLKKHGKDFWESLSWEKGGLELWSFCAKSFKEIFFLTSAGIVDNSDLERYPDIKSGKTNWILKNIPGSKKEMICVVQNKRLKPTYSSLNSILVDDQIVTINRWVNKGGIGIHHQKGGVRNTIDELKKYIPVQTEVIANSKKESTVEKNKKELSKI